MGFSISERAYEIEVVSYGSLNNLTDTTGLLSNNPPLQYYHAVAIWTEIVITQDYKHSSAGCMILLHI